MSENEKPDRALGTGVVSGDIDHPELGGPLNPIYAEPQKHIEHQPETRPGTRPATRPDFVGPDSEEDA